MRYGVIGILPDEVGRIIEPVGVYDGFPVGGFLTELIRVRVIHPVILDVVGGELREVGNRRGRVSTTKELLYLARIVGLDERGVGVLIEELVA